MAGVGFGPSDFVLFEIDDPAERGTALEATLLPKLLDLGERCRAGLSRVAGHTLHLHPARIHHRREAAPEEVLVALSGSSRGYRGLPYLGVALTREHLHARVGVRGESLRRPAMQQAVELAPAQSDAFWREVAEGLAPGQPGLDLGIAWTSDEARSVALGDVLGVFRDLAPLYKVLAGAA